MPITLTRIPHSKQVMALALLEQGRSLRAVVREVGISMMTVIAIKRRVPARLEEVERVKKNLPSLQYADAMEYRRHITPEKLENMSAYQLQGMISLAVTTARDMEGFNRPVYNILELSGSVLKAIEESKQRLAKFDSMITSSLPIKDGSVDK